MRRAKPATAMTPSPSMLKVPGSGVCCTSENWFVTRDSEALPFVPACSVMPSCRSTSLTPAKLALSNSLDPELLSETLRVRICPPLHDGSMAPKQAVSETPMKPVPVKERAPIERLRSLISAPPGFTLAEYWIVEVSSKIPELVDENHPALN